MPHLLEACTKSGGDSACLFLGDFFFGAEPVFYFVAVLGAACLIQLVGAQADLVFEFEPVARLSRL
jgi:hypothetical protein